MQGDQKPGKLGPKLVLQFVVQRAVNNNAYGVVALESIYSLEIALVTNARAQADKTQEVVVHPHVTTLFGDLVELFNKDFLGLNTFVQQIILDQYHQLVVVSDDREKHSKLSVWIVHHRNNDVVLIGLNGFPITSAYI